MVIQQNSRKLLMMDILMSGACRTHKKWSKISDIKFVFYSSTITMMHGPINISKNVPLLYFQPYTSTKTSAHTHTHTHSLTYCWIAVHSKFHTTRALFKFCLLENSHEACSKLLYEIFSSYLKVLHFCTQGSFAKLISFWKVQIRCRVGNKIILRNVLWCRLYAFESNL